LRYELRDNSRFEKHQLIYFPGQDINQCVSPNNVKYYIKVFIQTGQPDFSCGFVTLHKLLTISTLQLNCVSGGLEWVYWEAGGPWGWGGSHGEQGSQDNG
jgi:hypothetical protein